MGGFGAAAFSSLSPGCNVISFNPQSTLRADLVPWEKNHPNGRKQNWGGIFSDAADEVEHATIAYIFYDPYHYYDRQHALRFTSDKVRLMRSPFLGHGLPNSYKDMGILKDIMRRAIRGTLENHWFYNQMRRRKQNAHYYKELLRSLARKRHLRAGESIAERAFTTFQDPFFCQRRAVFVAALGDISQAMSILDALARSRRRAKRSRQS